MGKSLNRVRNALLAGGHADTIVEIGDATTAAQAAAELGCSVDQIAKSILFAGDHSCELFLFITAGAQKVDLQKATDLVGEGLKKADARVIRSITGFAIGGVSPVGHLSQPTSFIDATLFEFDRIFAAAGTPNHVFETTADRIRVLSNAKKEAFIE